MELGSASAPVVGIFMNSGGYTRSRITEGSGVAQMSCCHEQNLTCEVFIPAGA